MSSNSSQWARQHLMLRLRPINRRLRQLVGERAEFASKLKRPDLTHLCVTDQHVGELLNRVEQISWRELTPAISLTDDEKSAEAKLLQMAKQHHSILPIVHLVDSLSLSEFETAILLACAAPDCDSSYEAIYGFILDDLTRRLPCVELLCKLASESWLEMRAMLGPFGTLRSSGILETVGEVTTNARTSLKLAPGVMEYLLGESPSMQGYWRRTKDWLHTDATSIEDQHLQRIASGLASRQIEIVGVWGDGATNPWEAIHAIAQLAGLGLDRLVFPKNGYSESDFRLRLHQASCQSSLLALDIDSLWENSQPIEAILQDICRCQVPIGLVGKSPWRPTRLLVARRYAEVETAEPDRVAIDRRWLDSLPNVGHNEIQEVATRFQLSHQEILAVGNVATSMATIKSNGKPAKVEDQLQSACMTVVTKQPGRFLNNVTCRRNADDLILPTALHQQVMEIASFAKSIGVVSEHWGFGRLASGKFGMKCLFSGDPGTGKTLAAEVIASQIGTRLLKVNLAEMVSKWVGETEKNLNAAFDEATASHAILFFDEADALFGKRGEIKQGVDRYANLEVSHLLQRLEDHGGVVILATNLRSNIDSAFVRRFQTILHFPRPTEAERCRLWEAAFPNNAPLDPTIDRSQLSKLDLTGAGIFSVARTAALLAASRGDQSIQARHVVQAIARQFTQEGRSLAPRDLGKYAEQLLEVT